MLTEPEPLDQTVFHGRRPYVMGVASIETHKVFPTPIPQMVRGLQDEINEIKNQRLDNVKFVLNKGYFAKRGKNVSIKGGPHIGRKALLESGLDEGLHGSSLERLRTDDAFDQELIDIDRIGFGRP